MNGSLPVPGTAAAAPWSAQSAAPAGGLGGWTPNRFRRSPLPADADRGSAERTAFHRSLPGYAVTPLRELPDLAAEYGIGRLAVKDESSRLGLPAFKMLGASWAVYRCLAELYGSPEQPTLDALRARIAGRPPVRLVTATDGNHGRAVARMAGQLGLPATVLIPDTVSEAAIQAVRDEHAEVRVLDRPYDETVARAASLCQHPSDGVRRVLIQDTAWPGYETVPRWIVDGYGTLFDEAEDRLELGRRPALMVVPAGVGSLAHAAALHCRRTPGRRAVTVEPEVAPCIAASLAAGALVSTGTGRTAMAGLNCGTPSSLALPDLLAVLDGGLWVTDAEAADAAAALAARGIDAGPCGAASLAALRRLTEGHPGAAGLTAESAVLLLNTEAAR